MPRLLAFLPNPLYTGLHMAKRWWMTLLAVTATWAMLAQAEDLTGRVRKSVEQCTLNQPGTKPFHLKATLAPSLDRDKDSGRTGEVEIWWASPERWKREVRSPAFHQIQIVNGAHHWEKNEGDYFPQWLQQAAGELINPVPQLDQVLPQVKSAEVRHLFGQINIDWVTNTGTAEVHNILRSGIALKESDGQLLYAYGFGWGGGFKDYQIFHGRTIPTTVNVGSPQVTAKVVALEDLGEVPPGWFDAEAPGGDPNPLRTELIDEITLRKNLLPAEPIAWPPLQDGPLQGNVTTQIVVDREGAVREIGTMISENGGVNATGKEAVLKMRFKPFLVNGEQVQVMSQVTTPFKTVRPSGGEIFESAHDYFERGRSVGFPAAAAKSPYLLHAQFEAGAKEGVETGRYEDVWVSEDHWRREAWFGKSHYVRSQNGNKRYQLAEGPEASVLQLVFRVLEPIPAIDTFVESDWRIKRDTVNGTKTVRVLTGYESPEGQLDPVQVRAFWFDDAGLLLKTYFRGIETERADFQDFGTVKIAHHIDVLKDGQMAIRILVTDVTAADNASGKTFEVRGHEWKRAFTDEVR